MSVLYSYINQGWQSTIVTISSVKSLFQIAASAIRNSRFVSTEDLDCIAMASLSLFRQEIEFAQDNFHVIYL